MLCFVVVFLIVIKSDWCVIKCEKSWNVLKLIFLEKNGECNGGFAKNTLSIYQISHIFHDFYFSLQVTLAYVTTKIVNKNLVLINYIY